jgi:Peptidase M15
MAARKRTPTLKLADYYMGRDKLHRAELTRGLRANARETLRRVNRLLRRAGMMRKVTSGWRPAAINATVPGAATGSRHLSCLAIDLEDRNGALDAWCMANLAVLEELGLWLEHPAATPGWCHLQTQPPRSGNRVFHP